MFKVRKKITYLMFFNLLSIKSRRFKRCSANCLAEWITVVVAIWVRTPVVMC